MTLQSMLFLISMLSAPSIPSRLAAADVPGADVVIAHHEVHTTVAATGASTVVEKKLYKILTPKGAAQLSTLLDLARKGAEVSFEAQRQALGQYFPQL
ncbi:MAG: hypothetical protein CVU59_04265 [Deltaproteobacteria bacterium HGW-Deltaproteobacteria-17]|nr:MAG: hypothetical protein CVU59_04265 [Deltaproteobacteria bacterium HGW-Deltaproteobacteria-17]